MDCRSDKRSGPHSPRPIALFGIYTGQVVFFFIGQLLDSPFPVSFGAPGNDGLGVAGMTVWEYGVDFGVGGWSGFALG